MAQVTEIQKIEYSAANGRNYPIIVALGSNCHTDFGRPAEILEGAVGEISAQGITVEKMSPIFRSTAFPAGSGPDFANAALVASSMKNAADVLTVLGQIEDAFGRKRQKRWGPRTLDLDLIGFGDLVLPDASIQAHWRNLCPEEQQKQVPEQLILPHPRVQDRAFVLVPLAEVAPNWVHPVLKKTVRQMLDDLPLDLRSDVRMISNDPAD